MDAACGDGTSPSSTNVIKEEQVDESVMALLSAASSISCDSSHQSVPGPTQEELNKDYCMEATKLILDLSKCSLVYG